MKRSKINCSVEDVKKIFDLDDERFERPLKKVGNERLRAMAAIGYSCGKEIFCFPWHSDRRFEYYHGNLSMLLEMLVDLGKMAIVPVGTPDRPVTE